MYEGMSRIQFEFLDRLDQRISRMPGELKDTNSEYAQMINDIPIQSCQIQTNLAQSNLGPHQSHPRIKPLSMAITINTGRWQILNMAILGILAILAILSMAITINTGRWRWDYIHKRTALIQLTTSIICKCHHKRQ